MMETAGNPSLPAAVEKEPVAHDAAHEEIGPPKGISTKLLKHLHDADAAMKAFEGLDGQVIELTEEKSKAILRRIDWHLMPVRSLSQIAKNVDADIVTDHVFDLWTELSR